MKNPLHPEIDFGRQSESYATQRPGFPPSFYERLSQRLGFENRRALDLGCGPGVIALELAKRNAQVTGIDIAKPQIQAAQGRAAALGLEASCEFLLSSAEQTPFADQRFDLAIAGQCWHWFDQKVVTQEMKRVLKPGGHLVISSFCYLPRHCPIAKATEDLILQYNPQWSWAGSDGLFSEYIDPLLDEGFSLVEQFCFDHLQPFTPDGWIGRIRTNNGVGSGRLSDAQVRDFGLELAALLRTLVGESSFKVPHRVFAIVVQAP